MSIVCNSIAPQLRVSTPGSCGQFQETQQYQAACGAGSATDSCAISITGGVPPYQTTFSYTQVPGATGCTVSTSAFGGGSGSAPQFGYSFTAGNLCSMAINGTLALSYRVTDTSGQVVTGNLSYPVAISRTVAAYVPPPSGGGGGGGGGDRNPDEDYEQQIR